MVMKKILLVLMFSLYTFADFIGINPTELQKKIEEGVVVIDIRTAPEWKELGIVPSSKPIVFFDEKGNYDVEKWMNEFSKYVKDKKQPFVLVCRSGNRTGVVGNFLSKKLAYEKVYHLEKGIKSWIKENKEVIK